MTSAAAAAKTTPEDSSLPTSAQQTSSGVRAPILGWTGTPSTSTGSQQQPSPSGVNVDELQDPLDSQWDATATPSGSEETTNLKLGKRPLREIAKGLALGGSHLIHNVMARTQAEVEQGVWLMKEAEAAEVTNPLVSIAERRIGVGGEVAMDTADLINASLAILGYVIKNGVKAFQLRRATRVMRAMGITDPQHDPDADDDAEHDTDPDDFGAEFQ